MVMTLNRTLLHIEVTETEKGRGYWATRPWLTSGDDVRAAEIVVVPWEDFRENKPALFPHGTSDFYPELLAASSERGLAIAVDQTAYEEIALHANEMRLPTLFITYLALPFLINLLSAKVDRWLVEPAPVKTVEMEVIIEGDKGKCFSIKYKGPPSGMLETISKQAENCIPKLRQHGTEKSKPKQPK
jgi:hypothetical protein